MAIDKINDFLNKVNEKMQEVSESLSENINSGFQSFNNFADNCQEQVTATVTDLIIEEKVEAPASDAVAENHVDSSIVAPATVGFGSNLPAQEVSVESEVSEEVKVNLEKSDEEIKVNLEKDIIVDEVKPSSTIDLEKE